MKIFLKTLTLMAAAYGIFGIHNGQIEQAFGAARDPHSHLQFGVLYCYNWEPEPCNSHGAPNPYDDDIEPSGDVPDPPN